MQVVLDASLFTPSVLHKVQQLMDDAEVSGARVSAWDEIQEFLTEQKLGWITQTPPDVVGIHESNRSKLGVGGSEAHYHGFDILKNRFLLEEVFRCNGLRMPSCSPRCRGQAGQ